MHRCIDLAGKGGGWVTPNPMVGCVIVRKGRVVGEGYHQRFGAPHAEVNALQDAGRAADGATLYVNLEPCAHYGKTPPCVDSILEAGVREVVIASRDPNPLVRGRGIRRLTEAGVHVRVGVLRREAEAANERFFHFMRTGRPFVGIKLAQTLDGRIADTKGESRWITGEAARAEAHRLRAAYDAVLVGARTALRDDPQLTVRHVRGRNPIRVVLDGRLRIHERLRLCDTSEAETIVLTSERAVRANPARVKRLRDRGVRVSTVGRAPLLRASDLLEELASYEISSILVEGGAATASLFVRANAANRIHLFLAPALLGSGLSGLGSPGRTMRSILRMEDLSVRRFGSDLLVSARFPA